jgi:hypothetical protein
MKTLSKVLLARFALALGLLALGGPALADVTDVGSNGDNGSNEGYGYFRVVEGAPTVLPAGTDQRAAAEVNQPVLAGDHLWVPDHARAEILLADQNILRVDGGSELILERLAASPDRNDQATVVRLVAGNVQLVVTQDSLGDQLPRVETSNASIYPQYYGVYRITTTADGWSQVVVRRGTAEVRTDTGSSRVKADEEMVVDDRASDPDDRAAVREAGGFDPLERWARQLDDEFSGVDQRYVDDNLRYAAAPLARYGSWIDVNGSSYWRPQVAAGWRPYWQGRWVYTPSGLTWLSSEPWGWVPYHYGSWDYLPTYGWVWQPGSVWSAAWVYWYWGQDYVGWCPTGYYTRYYGPTFGVNVGFRNGVYGWAGGDWGIYDNWNFVSSSYFSYRDGYRNGYRDGYWDGHQDVRRYAVPVDHSRGAIGRGIITTDTKPLKPSVWKDPGGPLRALRGGGTAELPDVTPFVARKPNLPPAVARTVVSAKPQGLDGTPLRPGTLGRPGRRAGNPRPDPRPEGTVGRPTVVPGRPGRPAPEVDGGAPNPRISGRPSVSEPSVRGGEPVVREPVVREPVVREPISRERPGRPAPEADGGAPRPDRRPVVQPRPDRQPAEDRPPVVRERPVRPAPEANGGSPRPQPERRPEVQQNRPPERRPEVREERRPPERKPDNDDKKPPQSQLELYVMPRASAQGQPRVNPPSSYQAPEAARPATRYSPGNGSGSGSQYRPQPFQPSAQPRYQAPPAQPAPRPEVRPTPPQRSQDSRPQARETRPPKGSGGN